MRKRTYAIVAVLVAIILVGTVLALIFFKYHYAWHKFKIKSDRNILSIV